MQEEYYKRVKKKIDTIALVAHDGKKEDLSQWVKFNQKILSTKNLIATETTGSVLEKETKLKFKKVKSGKLGGDQQIGAMIAEEKIDMLIFLTDPLVPQPHDDDVKALVRLATHYSIPFAINRKTADMILTSTLF